MIDRARSLTKSPLAVPAILAPATRRVGFLSLVVVSIWCGLVAGLLEVIAIVIRKQYFDLDHFMRMSRQFVWLIPLINVCLFAIVGLAGCVVIAIRPRRGSWYVIRSLASLTVMPPLLVGFPRIHALAWWAVALGIATRVVPMIEAARPFFRRFVVSSFPVGIAIVVILAGSLAMTDRGKQARESARPLPPPGSPNVLLIVLDTVAAGRLSLHGYERLTSPTLLELADRGIRFDQARATSSWTLPSHSSMFTGRWYHELSVGWVTPLDHSRPTLAEFLGERGYATAGFVANTDYCATDSGLARGFTRYDDFIFPELTALATAVLADRAVEALRAAVAFSEDWLEAWRLYPAAERLVRVFDGDRKAASVVNRQLLEWLQGQRRTERPFFVFANYFDAHYPYQLPPGRLHRFGAEPSDSRERLLISQWGLIDKTTISPTGVAFVSDSYDDCVSDLDEHIGILVDELGKRGILEDTWLFITSDHGESFGEHSGYFCHGVSLYDTEVHVPLLVIPPRGMAVPRTVPEVVSLRDLAATIVDVVGQPAGSPFPGASLKRYWAEPATIEMSGERESLSELVPQDPLKPDASGLPRRLPPRAALKTREWSYLRRELDGREELFRLSADPREQRNLAGDPSARAVLEQMRASLDRATAGPLVLKRFNR